VDKRSVKRAREFATVLCEGKFFQTGVGRQRCGVEKRQRRLGGKYIRHSLKNTTCDAQHLLKQSKVISHSHFKLEPKFFFMLASFSD
jgi:hypothetical protein